MRPWYSLIAFSLAFVTGSLPAAANRIVFPQAAVGPIGGQEFEVDLRLANRSLQSPLTVTVSFLRQQALDGMQNLTAVAGEDSLPVSDGRFDLELSPGTSRRIFVRSPAELQVGPAVLEVSGPAEDLVPSFFYRLRSEQRIQDLVPIQPAREPALVYRAVIGRSGTFNVGLAVVAEAALDAVAAGLVAPATGLTLSVRLPDGQTLTAQSSLGGGADAQAALFPDQQLKDLPPEFDSAQLELSASSPVYVTMLAVGTPPDFEDVQIGATPAEVEAAARFPSAPGWLIPRALQALLVDANWGCAGGGLQEVRGGLVGSPAGHWQTTIHQLGPRLEIDGDFAVTAAVEAAPSLQGSLLLAGRPPTGSEWWQGMVRMDVGVAEGGVSVTGWNNSPTPVVSRLFQTDPPLSGRVRIRVERRASEWVIFAEDRELGRLDDFGLLADRQLWFGANLPPGEGLTCYGLAVEVPTATPDSVRLVSPPTREPAPERAVSLRKAAGARGVAFGAAVVPELIAWEPRYRTTLGGEFNMLVAENVMKWGLIHPDRHRYNFCPADLLLEYAAANGMQVRGHTLVWHQQNPGWLSSGDFSDADLRSILREHIRTVMGHYRGRIVQWDVLNEAIADNGTLRRTFWLERLGPEYIDLIFHWAREADPTALLFYNDYSIEEPGTKADAVLNLVRGMLERGVPIDGVGFQGHMSTAYVNTALFRGRFKANLQRFADLGLQLALTEVDVRVPVPASAAMLETQARIYGDMLGVCLELPGCRTFVTWGFTDRHSWIPGVFPGYGAALPFDSEYLPKPAYQALLAALQQVP